MPRAFQSALRSAVLLALWSCAPWLTNARAAAEARADDIRFTQSRGFYEKPVEIELSSKTAGSTIYYTTNGARPTRHTGSRYNGPLKFTTTTVLRAASFQDGKPLPASGTHTFLFLQDVVQQTGAGFPPTWGTNQNKPVPADYEMDPEIVTNTAYRAEILPALKSLPTLSIVMDPADLFGTEHGIYAHPRESGADWERPASVELIHPDGRPGFQVDCGIRIQGGWNRRPEESPKHSFRLVFKKKYGPGKLKFPLFGPGGVREFDTLILRGGCNNTWLHWSGEERRRGDFIRDQWMRDTFGLMGHPSARGVFVHLYLNGLYWGLYNPAERPSAPFVAAHLGGKPEDYDVRNGDNILQGDGVAWEQLMAIANAGVAGEPEFAAIDKLVDVPELINFLILNFYGANADWDHASNWYAARRRSPPGLFQFFIWDGERTLENPDDDSMTFDDDQSPPRLFQKLRGNAQFRKLFAEQARRHLAQDGALGPAKAAERYRLLSKNIGSAVVAESARWGDYRRDVHPYKTGPYELYTRDLHWRPEVDRLLTEYFPKRTDAVTRQFREAGLYLNEK